MKRALHEFWQSFGQASHICARKLWFLILYAFFIWCKFVWTSLFANLKQDHKVMSKKDICPKFCKDADRFSFTVQCFAPFTIIKWTICNRQQQIFWYEYGFNKTFWAKVACPQGWQKEPRCWAWPPSGASRLGLKGAPQRLWPDQDLVPRCATAPAQQRQGLQCLATCWFKRTSDGLVFGYWGSYRNQHPEKQPVQAVPATWPGGGRGPTERPQYTPARP